MRKYIIAMLLNGPLLMAEVHTIELFPFSTIVEYDKSTNRYCGRVREKKNSFFACTKPYTHTLDKIAPLPKFDGWRRGASAFDAEGQRFFFISDMKRKGTILTVIHSKTGQVIHAFNIPSGVRKIQYDPASKKLLALAYDRKRRSFSLMSITLPSGKTEELRHYPLFHALESGILLDSAKKRIYVIRREKREYIFSSIGLKNHRLKDIPGTDVKVNTYKAASFRDNEDKVLFTRGVQSCTAVAGYNDACKAGFIVHLRPGYERIDMIFSKIRKEIGSLCGKNALKNMQFALVGGVKGNKKSEHTLNSVYRYLLENYHLSGEEISRYNTGVSSSLFIYHGMIKVF